jgi:hypothetical protein
MWFVTALVLLPLILWVVAIWRPLTVTPDATSFVGRSRWKLTHVTGTVLASTAVARTHGSGGVYGSAASGTVTGSARVTTDVHETLRLQTSPTTQTDVEVVNYSVTAQPGDLVSIWTARKGGERFTIAVLNHTTNVQTVNEGDIFSILQPNQVIFVLYLCFTVLPVAFLSVFGGVPAFVLWFALLGLYVLGWKRARGNYEESGIAPIWERSRAEASHLSSLQASASA